MSCFFFGLKLLPGRFRRGVFGFLSEENATERQGFLISVKDLQMLPLHLFRCLRLSLLLLFFSFFNLNA